MKALVFAEKADHLNRISSKLKELGFEVHALSFAEVNADFLYLAGPKYDYASITAAIDMLSNEIRPDLVVFSSTKLGKEVSSRFAQRKNMTCITECLDLQLSDSSITVSRYSLGGKTVTKIRTHLPAVVALVADAIESKEQSFQMNVREFQIPDSPQIRTVSREEKRREAVGLKEADVIVVVGRGLRKEEDLKLVKELAKKLNAEIGCTRPLSHDYRWLPEERMIGLSGEKVSPKLLISIGVSGQIQHAVGIMNSKTVIAINTDENAPMKEHSDYFIVGDLYEILPELIKNL